MLLNIMVLFNSSGCLIINNIYAVSITINGTDYFHIQQTGDTTEDGSSISILI